MGRRADTEQPKMQVVDIAALIPDPANLREHPERSREALETSLRELGAARSVVVDSEGVIRAGNGTLEAAKAAGIKQAIVIETDGKQLVVVKRPDWSAEQALAYAIADNRTGELSSWAKDALIDALDGLTATIPLEVVGFTMEELAAFVDGGNPKTKQVTFERTIDDDFVAFKFGDYGGRVSKPVYDAFAAKVEATKSNDGEVMLDDALRSWLGGRSKK